MPAPHVRHTAPSTVDPACLAELAAVGATTAYEGSGRRGAMAAAVKPIAPGMSVCGPALTVALPPGDNLMMHRAVAMVRRGEVIVCAIDGWEGGPWGDLLTAQAMARGARGLVIDGYVRDGASIAAMGFPVFARGLSMKGAEKRALGLVNHPISCGGVVVRPGDVVVGDGDGVVAIRREDVAAVADAARARERHEDETRRRFLAGETSWASDGLERTAAGLGLVEEPGLSRPGAGRGGRG